MSHYLLLTHQPYESQGANCVDFILWFQVQAIGGAIRLCHKVKPGKDEEVTAYISLAVMELVSKGFLEKVGYVSY